MNKPNSFYFRVEKLQKKVKEAMALYKTVGKFSEKLGIDASNFNKTTGVNPERWRNPTADSLAKFSVFFDVPIDYFFMDDDELIAGSEQERCELCAEKERIIAAMTDTIEAQKIAISALQTSNDALKKASATENTSASISKTA